MSSSFTIKRICEFCKKEFIAKTTKTRYCSHKCNGRHYHILQRNDKILTAQLPKKEPSPYDDTINTREFLSISETASLLGTSKRTIERLIEKKRLPVAKIGSRTIIKRTNINQLFK